VQQGLAGFDGHREDSSAWDLVEPAGVYADVTI
jgi:hypothetical protein